MTKSWPGRPELLVRPNFYILGHFRPKKISTMFKIAPFLLRMQNSNYAYSAVSKHILCPSLNLVDLNYSLDHIFVFWNISGPKKSQQFSKLLHNSWRCKIQIMHIQQLASKFYAQVSTWWTWITYETIFLYFGTFQVQKNSQQLSKLLHFSWRCKIQIMHIQQ